MAKILHTLGQVTIILGIILGLVYGLRDDPVLEVLRLEDGSFKWLIAFSWWVSGAISGILFIAFGMMLDYLEENNRHLKELLHRTYVESSKSGPPKSSFTDRISGSSTLKTSLMDRINGPGQ
ncbi:hypothetical protein D1872_278030 [compost metagenome]